jgi:hypothetical protein
MSPCGGASEQLKGDVHMPRRRSALVITLALTALMVGVGAPVAADADSSEARVPPRLSYVDGEVSFWRPGAEDWTPAQLNTPLAPGDEFYTAHRGNVELQVGSAAFVRGWGDTQIGVAGHEANFLQVKVTTGHVAVDVKSLDPGQTLELATPHGALTITEPGYYRADVGDDHTAFVNRGSRPAALAPAGAPAVTLLGGQQVTVDAGSAGGRVAAAPVLDVWDSWNQTRTAQVVGAASASHVPAGVYGVEELDRHGDWRIEPTYGRVWIPRTVPAGWVPYSTGRWILDPYYGWTWVDTAPWGWAPYHYGRWVFVRGVWAWAPGPRVIRPVYAPALVAFFGAPGVRVTVTSPFVGWVALGWGEPVVPWWGPVGFVGRPWWGGWGGPRKTVSVTHVTVYNNVTVRNAVVVVDRDHFGRAPVRHARVRDVDVRRLEPVHGPLRVTPVPASFSAGSGRAVRPPDQTVARRVVTSRTVARPVARPEERRTDPGLREMPRRRSEGFDAMPRSNATPNPTPTPRPAVTPRPDTTPPPDVARPEPVRREAPPRRDPGGRPGGTSASPEPGRRPDAGRALRETAPQPPADRARGGERAPEPARDVRRAPLLDSMRRPDTIGAPRNTLREPTPARPPEATGVPRDKVTEPAPVPSSGRRRGLDDGGESRGRVRPAPPASLQQRAEPPRRAMGPLPTAPAQRPAPDATTWHGRSAPRPDASAAPRPAPTPPRRRDRD